MSDERVVLCMKWGTLYSADYVNVLYRAACENLTGSFRFVCLTDDANGFCDGVEHFPIPDIGLQEKHWNHGAWPKLSVFSADLYGLKGRALFIDMDTVICGSLDDMFTYPGRFVGIDTGRNWISGRTDYPALLGTGVFAFDLGAHADILDKFKTNCSGFFARDDLEQVYVQNEIGEIEFWPFDWVPSFKYHLRYRYCLNLLLPPKKPASNAKTLAFHGDPRPIDLIESKTWGVFPHLGRGPVKWFSEYWTKHGGH